MQNSVAAIRAGHTHTRFVLPTDRRERHLGLRRRSHVPPRRAALASVGVGPLEAIRRAARGITPVHPATELSTTLGRRSAIHWGRQTVTSLRRGPTRSAAPWLG